MAFSFVMAKSVIGWSMIVIFALLYYLARKPKKFFVPMMLCLAGVFTIFLLISVLSGEQGAILKDVFSYGFKSPFGNGGGFFSAREMIFSAAYKTADVPGLFATMCASSGIIGIAFCLFAIVRVVMQFIKLKTWESGINVFLTAMIMFLPLATSLIPLFFWIGIIAYNENAAGLSVKRAFNEKTVKYVTIAISVVGIAAVLVLCQNFVKISAKEKYNSGEYLEAFDLYKTATVINFTDSESCRMAAMSLCRSEAVESRYTEALELIKKSQARDEYNIENMKIKAEIYKACEMHNLCAQEYEAISLKVKANDRYNLEAAKAYYKIICTKEKGSAEAKAVYEKMIAVADRTKDLDYKEKVNDFVIKAFNYTKGELNVE